MPEQPIDASAGRHALLMLRLSLMGLSEVERGRGDPTEQEVEEARALCTVTVTDATRLLDVYLTGGLHRRDPDGGFIVDLVHRNLPWDMRLSNEIGSVVKLHKPSVEDIAKGRQCVVLDMNGPLDQEIRRRWRRIDHDTRTDAELKPLGEQMYEFIQGKGFGPRKKPEKVQEDA